MAPLRPPSALALLIVGTLAVTACSVTEGTIGSLNADGMTVAGCMTNEPFSETFNALSIDACKGFTYVRAQDANTPINSANGLFIRIEEQVVSELAAGEGIGTYDVATDGVSVSLYLHRTCPESFAALEAVSGTITVESLTTNTGGDVRISGVLDVHDAKGGEPVATGLTFEIDTSDSSYRPMRDYPICP